MLLYYLGSLTTNLRVKEQAGSTATQMARRPFWVISRDTEDPILYAYSSLPYMNCICALLITLFNAKDYQIADHL